MEYDQFMLYSKNFFYMKFKLKLLYVFNIVIKNIVLN